MMKGTFWYTQLAEKLPTRGIYQMWYCDIASYSQIASYVQASH